jgi:predicted transposase/invertase (TIGR01784 family)
VYYSSLSVQDQARVEKEYQKTCERVWDYYFAPVYQISFLNFPNTLVEPKEEGNGSPYISHYVYKSKDTGRELGDETNIVFVDLAKFRKKFEECDNQCERWLYSIKNMHLLKSAPIGVAGTELEELYGEAHFAAWTPEKRSLYEKSIMNRNDYENILCERYEDGFAAGIEEGREEGREEGLVLAAKNMIAQGLPIDVIMQVTGLSEAQLEKL